MSNSLTDDMLLSIDFGLIIDLDAIDSCLDLYKLGWLNIELFFLFFLISVVFKTMIKTALSEAHLLLTFLENVFQI